MTIRQKLYLDIDGVLITAKNPKAADYVGEFIDYILSRYDVYWLTTHCDSDASAAIDYLKDYLPLYYLDKLKTVKPTQWDTLKTEAIDFSSDFIWLDDYAMQAERNFLATKSKLNNLIIVNLNNESELKRIIKLLDAGRIKGCIFGQAIGDALGLGTEFMSAEEVRHHYPNGLSDYSQIIQDKHRRRFIKGRWTDDTDMMLCVLYGIRNFGEIDVQQVAVNFKAWAEGLPMGIGRHTYEVLSLWDYLQDPFKAAEIIWELSGRESAANGGIMRTCAVGLLKENVSEYAEKVCRLTHPDPRCVKSCILISELISSLIWKGAELEYDDMVSVAENDVEFIHYLSKAKECDDISQLELDDLKSMGYTYKTMSAALWALWHCSSFEEGLLTVVNAGGDADTNAAVACSVLGAKYGFSAIPEKYVQGLYASDLLDKISYLIIKKLLL